MVGTTDPFSITRRGRLPSAADMHNLLFLSLGFSETYISWDPSRNSVAQQASVNSFSACPPEKRYAINLEKGE